MSFFSDNLKNINLYGVSVDGYTLREPQIGAYMAVCSHFTCYSDVATVVIPTGVGKTATMTLIPFGLKAHRVLVIAPSKTVRGQIFEEFNKLNIFHELNIFTKQETPKVFEVKKSINNDETWEDLKNYDVIVSTPHCISSKYDYVKNPNDSIRETLFDLIIIDEAHHIPAETWQYILKQFKNTKNILFTATPFRRDKKILPGTQVYAYPLSKAIENEYYEKISYLPIEINPNENKDVVLAKKAKEQFNILKSKNSDIKMLIKVESKENAKLIKKIYDKIGLKVKIVSSDNSYKNNKEVICELKTNRELDGLICIDMLGEGFDFPKIKLAVLHATPQSLLPFIQFVGRIARKIGEEKINGVLIADKNDFSKEIDKITDDYNKLEQLIPNLIDSLVQERRDKKIYYDEFETETLGFNESINLENICPSFTVKMYTIQSEYFSFERDIKLTGSIKLEEYRKKDNLAIFITSREIKPKWTKSNLLKSKEYHLNIFYYDTVKKILLHHTTDENVGNCLLDSLCEISKLHKAKMNYLFQLMQIAQNAEYINIGVKNPLRLVGGSYENYMGKDAQNSISIIQSSYQCLGHAFAKLEFSNSNEYRGISPFNAKVWSFKKGDIESFTEWCKLITDSINLDEKTNFELPNLPLKANLFPISEIQGNEILCLVLNQSCYKENVILKTQTNNTQSEFNILDIDFKLEKKSNKTIKINMFYNEQLLTSVLYDLNNEDTIFNNFGNSNKFYVATNNKTYTLPDFFNEYLPMIMTDEGESIIGCLCFKVGIDNSKELPIDKIFEHIDCAGNKINIKQEIPFKGETRENKSIFTYLKEKFENESNNEYIIKDDGSGEIADFIVITNNEVKFYHCKASKEAVSGLRIKEFYEVIGQAIKSSKWIRNSDIFNQLMKRINSNPKKLIKGDLNNLKKLKAHHYNYKIYVVQPGLDYVQFVNKQPADIKKLIALGYDVIKSNGEFKVICNG